MPKPLAVGALAGVQSGGLATPTASRSPVAVEAPGVLLATPPASSIVPVDVAVDHGGIVGAMDWGW